MGGKRLIEKWISKSKEETLAIGRLLGRRFSKGDILCFSGDLGAGKTTIIKGLIQEITHIPIEQILSPTFVTMQLYDTIAHFDLYRLQGPSEFVQNGFEEFLEGHHLVCIEWAERISSLLPSKTIDVKMEHLSENEREVALYV